MNPLKISENLLRLRKDRKITQEELADFIGVTKASVSKWENGLSMPDVLLLPQLAAYFNVSLDALFGYEPQLSREQIQRIYLDFAAAFATRPFEEVLAEVRATIRKYYACYPLLLQLCVLYLNHFFMAKDTAEAQNLLREARGLCGHILDHCKSVSVSSDATSLKALIDLQLGSADAVIEVLEPMLNPARLSRQDDATLVQAYWLAGKPEQAIDFSQVSLYLNLVSFISASVQYMAMNGSDGKSCEETIRRVDSVAKAYKLDRLHPNITAQFQYQAALVMTALGKHQEALARLDAYAKTVCILFDRGQFKLHGDDYFTRVDPWFDKLALGANPPRDMALVRQSALQALDQQPFEPLRQYAEFKALRQRLEKE
ncbi:MAG: helix-turn-helix transcriptional regulator [Bacillota bacterium]